MNEINLGTIRMPLNAVTKTFAVLAKRGAGKTYAAAVLAEELYKNNIPFVVFDPIDVWWGLRFAKDGKNKGLPVVVFGLEHSDIKLDRNMGRDVARAIITDNISCVISTFGMAKVAQRHLIAEFADELLKINNTPRHIFIEEAHEFVPQRVFGGSGAVFNAVSNLIVMGRNRGIGVTLINQRAATINKDVLTQIDTLIALRNVGPQDRNALRDWVEYHTAEGDFEMFIKSLPSLPTGEGWLWSPEFLNTFQKIKIRQRETFHPDREKLGENFQMPELNQIDIQTFIQKFSSRLKTAEKKEDTGKKAIIIVEERENKELINLRNEYESKTLQKDLEIRRLNQTIESIRKTIGGSEAQIFPTPSSGGVEMWIEKLGRNNGAARILKFLNEKSGMKFTKSQVALGVGMSPNGGSYNTYLSTLRTNKLIIQENDYIRINPDL